MDKVSNHQGNVGHKRMRLVGRYEMNLRITGRGLLKWGGLSVSHYERWERGGFVIRPPTDSSIL